MARVTPISFIENILKATFTGWDVHTAEGKDAEEWLTSTGVKVPAALVSYHGFNSLGALESNISASDDEVYSIYLRADNSLREHAETLRTAFKTGNEFIDMSGEVMTVTIRSGQIMRDKGKGTMEILAVVS